jgi:hypothetical protein
MARAARRQFLVTPIGHKPDTRSHHPSNFLPVSRRSSCMISSPCRRFPCRLPRDHASSDCVRASKGYNGRAARRDAQLPRNTDGLRPTAQIARGPSVRFVEQRPLGFSQQLWMSSSEVRNVT